MRLASVIWKNGILKNRYQTLEVRRISRCGARKRSTELSSWNASDDRLVTNYREMVGNNVGNSVAEVPHCFAIEIERRPSA